MEKRGLPQEGLKVLACLTMLVDHTGAAFYPGLMWLRVIGRLAFPIYCFALAQGTVYTRNSARYGLRLLLGALLSELPFDLLFSGGWDWLHQSVMLTLLLGFLALQVMKKCPNLPLKVLAALPFALAAELLRTDYGGMGVLMIAMFALTEGLPQKNALRTACLLLICCFIPSAHIRLFGLRVSVQLFAAAAMVPIALYSGRKLTYSHAAQTALYLFYPVHLLALYLIRLLTA